MRLKLILFLFLFCFGCNTSTTTIEAVKLENIIRKKADRLANKKYKKNSNVFYCTYPFTKTIYIWTYVDGKRELEVYNGEKLVGDYIDVNKVFEDIFQNNENINFDEFIKCTALSAPCITFKVKIKEEEFYEEFCVELECLAKRNFNDSKADFIRMEFVEITNKY